MAFQLPPYHAPRLPQAAPGALFLPAPRDGVAPENYHATTIFPKYFHVDGAWLLAEDSRMDCGASLVSSGTGEDGVVVYYLDSPHFGGKASYTLHITGADFDWAIAEATLIFLVFGK